MGEGRREKAQEIFSLLIAATVVSGLVIAVISILFLPQIAAFLGAKGGMLADCIRYGRIILVALPFLMLQYAFGSLSVTAEKRSWADCNDHFGCAQYDGRCSVHGGVPLGNCRSGDGDCDGTDHRRNDTAGLFPAEEQQQPPPSQTKVGWRSAQTCLHQRCIGIDEQYFHCPIVGMLYNGAADALRGRKRSRSLRNHHVCGLYFLAISSVMRPA